MANCNYPCPLIADAGTKYISCGNKTIVMHHWIHAGYQSCSQDRLAKSKKPMINPDIIDKTKLHQWCDCIESFFVDCRLYIDHPTCHIAYQTIFYIQLLIIVTAFLLNASICYAYLKKFSLRQKNPQMLLFNQAICDIVNCLLYSIPNVIIWKLNEQIPLWSNEDEGFTIASTALLILTVLSSLFIFTIIATERFLSIYKPVWHRVKMTKSRLWRAIATAWFLSIIAGVLTIIVMLNVKMDVYDDTLYNLKAFLIALISILLITISTLHIWSFVLAYRSVHSSSASNNNSNSNNSNNNNSSSSNNTTAQSKKELRLVILFAIMFIIFFIGFSPLIFEIALDQSYYSLYSQTLFTFFMLTSLLNPLLTLSMRAEFRLFSIDCHSVNTNHDGRQPEAVDTQM